MEAVDPTVFRLSIFVLAIFVGYYRGLERDARPCTRR